MRFFNIYGISVIIVLGMSSCLDVVEVSLDEGVPQLHVDAFLTDIHNPEVVLSLTQEYFDASETNFVSDAQVTLSDGDTTYTLVFEDNAYRYDTPLVGEVGTTYTLNIEYDGNVYEATSITQPVTPLMDDSLTYEFEEGAFGFEGGFLAEVRAYDIEGREDYYWIRHFRNDTLILDPEALILAKDAAFGGEGTDGALFIPPIRQAVNDFTRLYSPGENLKVEIWSIEENTWQYLNEVLEQSSIGGALAIISPPTYNLRTNITRVSGDGEFPALGMFSVSKVSRNEVTFED